MGTLFIHRVYRTKAECVWAGPFGSRDESLFPLPSFLETVLRTYLVIPKEHCGTLAQLIYPYGDEAAKIIEAYPSSFHHAAVQEFGIGLALSHEKWTKGWPQFQWEVLDAFFDLRPVGLEMDWGTCKYEWSIEQLAQQRKKRERMPRGLDKKVWDMLGVLRK